MPLSNSIKAYWRNEYAIKGVKRSADPFRGYARANAKKKLIVVKGKTGCMMLNKFPYSPGHLLVIPYRAVGDIAQLSLEENRELFDLMLLGKSLLAEVLAPDGLNIGINQGESSACGSSVPKHAHWHIVPRWKGDHSFFTIISGSRVLLRSQEGLWVAMRAAYARRMAPKAKKKTPRKK